MLKLLQYTFNTSAAINTRPLPSSVKAALYAEGIGRGETPLPDILKRVPIYTRINRRKHFQRDVLFCQTDDCTRAEKMIKFLEIEVPRICARKNIECKFEKDAQFGYAITMRAQNKQNE
jgi:hypothetical protein